jgi:ribulose-phosphate 3-epimerase
MTKIYPSLLSADFAHLGAEIQRWDALGIDGFHLDVMDGHFVPNLTMGPSLVKSIRPYTLKAFDVHLMVTNPDMFIEPFIAAGADRISFHVELEGDLTPLIAKAETHDKKVGLALNPATSVEKLAPYLPMIDFVLLMTVEPGFAGGQFVAKALDKIPEILVHDPSIDIVVDGGISPKTAPRAVELGAAGLVAGSSLFAGGPDRYRKNLAALQRATGRP